MNEHERPDVLLSASVSIEANGGAARLFQGAGTGPPQARRVSKTPRVLDDPVGLQRRAFTGKAFALVA